MSEEVNQVMAAMLADRWWWHVFVKTKRRSFWVKGRLCSCIEDDRRTASDRSRSFFILLQFDNRQLTLLCLLLYALSAPQHHSNQPNTTEPSRVISPTPWQTPTGPTRMTANSLQKKGNLSVTNTSGLHPRRLQLTEWKRRQTTTRNLHFSAHFLISYFDCSNLSLLL